MEIKEQLIAIMDEECNIDVEVDQTLYKKPGWAVIVMNGVPLKYISADIDAE